jgi:hypothetical protein
MPDTAQVTMDGITTTMVGVEMVIIFMVNMVAAIMEEAAGIITNR